MLVPRDAEDDDRSNDLANGDGEFNADPKA
jgi:hypothetical protein